MDRSANMFSLSRLWVASRDSLRANVVPGILLSLIGVGVVFLYYRVEGLRDTFVWIGELRARHGFLYSGLATALFGGAIPFLFLWVNRRIPPGRVLGWGVFLVVFWAIRGMEVDAFYRLQAWKFGEEPNARTISVKVLVDQFVYCPFWSAPVTTFFYAWRDAGFSWKVLRPRLGRSFLIFEVPSVLLSIWVVWIPATAIIYSLPSPLQIPLFNLVLCFYVLLVSVLSMRSGEAAPVP